MIRSQNQKPNSLNPSTFQRIKESGKKSLRNQLIRRARQSPPTGGCQNKSPGQGHYIMTEDPFFGKVISTYTTREAVYDGFLVKVDQKISSEVGIKYPVYLTRSAWDKYVCVPVGLEHQQDETGRLWDLLYMFRMRAKQTSGGVLNFTFISQHPNFDWSINESRVSDNPIARLVTLRAECRAQDFDDPSPAIFIMVPGED